LSLRARASSNVPIPGTWGFGLWNDPFSLSLGFGGGGRRFPALPNAAWFFFASPPNYLSLRDDLPAQGSLASVFRAPNWPAPLLALGAPFLALLAWPAAARRLRRLGRRLINEDSASLELAPTDWHLYAIEWLTERVDFWVDSRLMLTSAVVPRGPLGLVIWVDNQYAAFPPGGKLAYGTLLNHQAAWLEIADVEIL
jgi:hypothetical protein